MTEAGLQAKIKKYLVNKGCLVYKFASPSSRGVPDLLVVLPFGDAFFIEVKNPAGTGSLSKLQEAKIAALREHNMLVLVTDNYEYACNWCDQYLAVKRPTKREEI